MSTPLEIRLYAALKRISQYQSPDTLRRRAARDWGLDDPEEAIEYAYENVLAEAKAAIKGVRTPKAPDPTTPEVVGEATPSMDGSGRPS